MKKNLTINTMISDGCPDIAPEQSRYKHDADLDGIIDD